jgi:hypothetical protein
MIYEALTAGCRVGVIQIDRLKKDRITQSVDSLMQKNLISQSASMMQLAAPAVFKEAERAAFIMMN